MLTRKAVFAATFALGAATSALAQSAPQQPAAQGEAAASPQRSYDLSRAERTALQPLLTSAQARDWTAAAAALPAAQEAARGADARYLIALIQFQMGTNTQNEALRSQGIDGMLATGTVPAGDQVGLLTEQANIAARAGDVAKANRALEQVIALNPQDPLAIPRAAQLWTDNNNPAQALAFYQAQIAAAQAANRPISSEVRRLYMAAAYRQRSPQTMTLMREFLVSAPTPTNWHDALLIFLEFTPNADTTLKLDTYRLMRAANALTAERDFVEYAEAANRAAAFGEVKDALERGQAANAITTNRAYATGMLNTANTRIANDRPSLAGERTTVLAGNDANAALRLGDGYFGYGEYGPAVELYRAALQKGAEAGLANLRIGAALALAGQRAEAETALRAVTGPRAELAQLWLLWLSTPRS